MLANKPGAIAKIYFDNLEEKSDTLQFLSILKGIPEYEILNLLLIGNPDLTVNQDLKLEEEAGVPEKTIETLRLLKPNIEKLLPFFKAKEQSDETDPVNYLFITRKIPKIEALRMLWVATKAGTIAEPEPQPA